jgi:hypothetical protein
MPLSDADAANVSAGESAASVMAQTRSALFKRNKDAGERVAFVDHACCRAIKNGTAMPDVPA